MKLPALQFYPGDWRKDPGVQSLTYEERGIWIEMIFLMHESDRRGKLMLNGKPVSDERLAQLLHLDKQKIKQTINTLLELGVASLCDETGALMNRRMVRDEELIDKRRKAGQIGGKSGGNPAFEQGKPNPYYKAKDKALAEQAVKPEIKQTYPPSSSSSSSISTTEEKKEKERSLASLAGDVFAFWREHLNHPNAIFDGKRGAAIMARLKEGYTVEQLLDAVRGCALSDFHMGREPGKPTVHDEIRNICKDAAHVDMFLARKENSNGTNQSRPETASARNLKGNLEYLRRVQGESGPTDPENAPRQLAP